MDTQSLIVVIMGAIFALLIFSPHYLGYFFANKLKKPRWAITLYTWMINLNVTTGSAYINRSQAYILLGEYQQALQDVERGLQLRPNSAIGYGNRGTIYSRLKQYQRAVQNYSKAIELKPAYFFAYQNRCLMYIWLKAFDLALQDCEYVLSVQPANFRALNHLIVCCVYLGHYQRAIEQANYALKLKSDDANCYHNRGSAYLGLNQPGQAKKDYLRSQELDPGNISHGLALEWYRLGFEQPDGEMPARLEALSTYTVPERLQYAPYLCRGIALWLRGAYEESLIELERAIVLERNDEEVYFWVGMACAALERDAEARDALEHALQLGLPRFLLAPLKLLQERRPEFFAQYAQRLPA